MPPQNQAASGSKPAPTVQSVVADPKFRALDRTSQTQVLAQIDPRFARLSEDDRGAVVERLMTSALSTSPDGLNPPPFGLPSDTRISPRPDFATRAANETTRLLGSAFNEQFPFVHPLDAASTAIEDTEGLTSSIENYTQAGRAEHPILSRLGDFTRGLKDLVHIVGPEVATLGLPEARDIAEPLADERLAPGRIRSGEKNIEISLNTPPGRAGDRATQMRRDIRIATPDLARIERETPMARRTLGQKVRGRGDAEWFNDTAANIAVYKRKLWEDGHSAPVARHAKMPFDNTRVVEQAQAAIRPQDDLVQAQRARKWIERELPRVHTLADADERIRLLNNELRSLPEAYGPVGLRVREAAIQGLRKQLDAQLEAVGEKGVRNVNQRYGALANIEDRLRERYFQETGKSAREPALPDWAHVYVFGTPHGAAVGTSVRVGRMFLPEDAMRLRKGMRKLEKSGVRPAEPFTPPYVGKKPAGLLPPPGESSVTTHGIESRAPGGPSTKPLPMTGELFPGSSGEHLARIPGRPYRTAPATDLGERAPGGPRTTLPSHTGSPAAAPEERGEALARIPGRSYRPPQSTSLRTPPPGYSSPVSVTSMPEIETALARDLRAGKLSPRDILQMAKEGRIGQGAPARIFKVAGVKFSPPPR